MNHKSVTIPAVFLLGVIGLYCWGGVSPSSLNWGVHVLGFLPGWCSILYCLASLTILFLGWKGYTDRLLTPIAQIESTKPLLFLSSVLGIFILFALIFRVTVPLLGDSFILLNNYENTFSGEHPLYLHRAPLAFVYFYCSAIILGVTKYPELLNAFLWGEIILGIGFIINVFYSIRNLFEDEKTRVLSFILLITLPGIELFFGYVELYSMVLFTVSLFVLLSILSLKRKLSLWIVPPAFLLMCSANYLMAILSPALLYVTILEWKENNRWTIALGYAIALGVAFTVLASTNFDIQKFIPPSQQAHYLSLTGRGDKYEPYSLFSIYHGVDVGNLILLLGLPALFLIVFSFLSDKRVIFRQPISIFLASAVILAVGFISIAKFDLGIAKDWDVNTPFFFLFTFLGLVLYLGQENSNKLKALTMLTSIAVLNSLLWVSLCSTKEPIINRMKTLLDSRITSADGYYQSVFHITMYYQHENDQKTQIIMWEDYRTKYPNDWRGYQNLTQALNQDGEKNDPRAVAVYEDWFKLDPEHAKEEYANFLTGRGIQFQKRGFANIAEFQFKRAIEINPAYLSAYNNLAAIYFDSSQYDKAISLCKRAIEQNPRYAPAYINLGNSYLQKSLLDSAITSYKMSVELDPANTLPYENLSKAYYQKGETEQAMAMLRIAARLGSKTAQYLLSQSGQQW